METQSEWGLILRLWSLSQNPEGKDQLQIHLDRFWTIFINNSAWEARWKGLAIPPHCVGVTYEGLPAGVLAAQGGCLAPGLDSDSFVAALNSRLAELQYGLPHQLPTQPTARV